MFESTTPKLASPPPGPLAPFLDDVSSLMEQIAAIRAGLMGQLAALRRDRNQWREIAHLAITQLHEATDRNERLTLQLIEAQGRLVKTGSERSQRTAA